MKSLLSDLGSTDKFNIAMFSTSVTVWKSESVLATSGNIAEAKRYIETQTADGSKIKRGLFRHV